MPGGLTVHEVGVWDVRVVGFDLLHPERLRSHRLWSLVSDRKTQICVCVWYEMLSVIREKLHLLTTPTGRARFTTPTGGATPTGEARFTTPTYEARFTSPTGEVRFTTPNGEARFTTPTGGARSIHHTS